MNLFEFYIPDKEDKFYDKNQDFDDDRIDKEFIKFIELYPVKASDELKIWLYTGKEFFVNKAIWAIKTCNLVSFIEDLNWVLRLKMKGNIQNRYDKEIDLIVDTLKYLSATQSKNDL